MVSLGALVPRVFVGRPTDLQSGFYALGEPGPGVNWVSSPQA